MTEDTSRRPAELTAEEFLDFLSTLDETPPCVPGDHICTDGSFRIKESGICCYTSKSGDKIEALVCPEGLILVSPLLWEILQA